MQEMIIRAPLGAAMLEPDSIIIERPGWYQIVTPSLKDASLNEVILSQIEDRQVDQYIAGAFDRYEQIGTEFKWSIGPMSNSKAIEPRIRDRALDSWGFRGMVIKCSEKITYPEELHVERVQSGNYEQFIDVYLNGWGLQKYRKAAESKFRAILHPGSPQRYFLATINGYAVAAAGTILKEDCGYLVGAVVLEGHRGSGAYRALLHHRISDLAGCKREFAVTHAREATSAPILQKLGFQTGFRATIYKLK